MGLVIVGRNGRTGQVIIQDDRPNGARLIFVCDIIEGFHGGIAVPPGESPQPLPQENPSPGKRGKFPWIESLQFESQEPFHLTVDTTSLSAEDTFFLTGKFIDRAVDAAEQGDVQITLTAENSAEWGQVNPSTSAAPAGVGI